MRDRLDADAVRRWCTGSLAALRRRQQEIDALNVFPVADSDTGTNLVATLQAAVTALRPASDQGSAVPGPPTPGGVADPPAPGGAGPTAREVWTAMARGALLGARGNSGMILSQLLAGAAEALPEGSPVRGRALARSLDAAVDAGYAAVVEPVEGTVLSVARAAARGAVAADSDELAVVSAAALSAARLALDGTPAQLAALGVPAVVDAGGRGLVVMLGVLDAVVRDEPLEADDPPGPAHGVLPPASTEQVEGWEIQYLLDVAGTPGPAIERLRSRLVEVGDSVVVACADRGDGTASVWAVHVHANDIGAALEAGLDAGRPHHVAVTPLITGHDVHANASTGQPSTPPSDSRDAPPAVATGAVTDAGARPSGGPGDGRAVVAVVPGSGLARLFAAEGAVPVELTSGAAPSVETLLDAVKRAGAAEIVLLPNDVAHAAVADAASAAAGPDRTVSVLHTRSPVQGIAALAVADAGRPFREDVVAMAEAAAATRTAEVVVADQAGWTMAGPCRPGDVLALVDGDVVAIGADVGAVARELLDRLLNAGGELVTLVLGVDAPPTLAGTVRAHLRVRWPFCEVHLLDGGQPRAVLLVGVE